MGIGNPFTKHAHAMGSIRRLRRVSCIGFLPVFRIVMSRTALASGQRRSRTAVIVTRRAALPGVAIRRSLAGTVVSAIGSDIEARVTRRGALSRMLLHRCRPDLVR